MDLKTIFLNLLSISGISLQPIFFERTNWDKIFTSKCPMLREDDVLKISPVPTFGIILFISLFNFLKKTSDSDLIGCFAFSEISLIERSKEDLRLVEEFIENGKNFLFQLDFRYLTSSPFLFRKLLQLFATEGKVIFSYFVII